MEKVFNFICGVIAALITLCGTFITGLLIYDYHPNAIGIFAIALFGVTMSCLAFKLFDEIYSNGIIEFMTSITATSDLDNLRYTHGSNFKNRTPLNLIDIVATDQHLCKGGTLRIFGDWFGEPYENFHSIARVEFDTTSSVLTIYFEEGKTLKIWNPQHIHETATYLKVIFADKIKLQWKESDDTKNVYFQEYEKTGRKIKFATNFHERKRKVDTSAAEAALMVYGKME